MNVLFEKPGECWNLAFCVDAVPRVDELVFISLEMFQADEVESLKPFAEEGQVGGRVIGVRHECAPSARKITVTLG